MKKKLCYFFILCILTKLIALECWKDNRKLPATEKWPCTKEIYLRVYFDENKTKPIISKQEYFNNTYKQLMNAEPIPSSTGKKNLFSNPDRVLFYNNGCTN